MAAPAAQQPGGRAQALFRHVGIEQQLVFPFQQRRSPRAVAQEQGRRSGQTAARGKACRPPSFVRRTGMAHGKFCRKQGNVHGGGKSRVLRLRETASVSFFKPRQHVGYESFRKRERVGRQGQTQLPSCRQHETRAARPGGQTQAGRQLCAVFKNKNSMLPLQQEMGTHLFGHEAI